MSRIPPAVAARNGGYARYVPRREQREPTRLVVALALLGLATGIELAAWAARRARRWT